MTNDFLQKILVEQPIRLNLHEAVSKFERELIREAILRSGGNKANAARMLGIPRTTMVMKMKKLGMPL